MMDFKFYSRQWIAFYVYYFLSMIVMFFCVGRMIDIILKTIRMFFANFFPDYHLILEEHNFGRKKTHQKQRFTCTKLYLTLHWRTRRTTGLTLSVLVPCESYSFSPNRSIWSFLTLCSNFETVDGKKPRPYFTNW